MIKKLVWCAALTTNIVALHSQIPDNIAEAIKQRTCGYYRVAIQFYGDGSNKKLVSQKLQEACRNLRKKDSGKEYAAMIKAFPELLRIAWLDIKYSLDVASDVSVILEEKQVDIRDHDVNEALFTLGFKLVFDQHNQEIAQFFEQQRSILTHNPSSIDRVVDSLLQSLEFAYTHENKEILVVVRFHDN